jgi:hypothetical protein
MRRDFRAQRHRHRGLDPRGEHVALRQGLVVTQRRRAENRTGRLRLGMQLARPPVQAHDLRGVGKGRPPTATTAGLEPGRRAAERARITHHALQDAADGRAANRLGYSTAAEYPAFMSAERTGMLS